MRTTRFLSVVATSVALTVVGVLSTIGAGAGQQSAARVAIDNDDIGGVVTGPQGPEAGVWVIAETTDTADPLDQERRHRRSGPLPACPICRRRTTTCGSAATGSSTRRR